MMCEHVYTNTGSVLCPSCNNPTNEVNWELHNAQHKDWIESGKATEFAGWTSI